MKGTEVQGIESGDRGRGSRGKGQHTACSLFTWLAQAVTSKKDDNVWCWLGWNKTIHMFICLLMHSTIHGFHNHFLNTSYELVT